MENVLAKFAMTSLLLGSFIFTGFILKKVVKQSFLCATWSIAPISTIQIFLRWEFLSLLLPRFCMWLILWPISSDSSRIFCICFVVNPLTTSSLTFFLLVESSLTLRLQTSCYLLPWLPLSWKLVLYSLLYLYHGAYSCIVNKIVTGWRTKN